MKGVRVLLLEDNAVNVLVASQFLKSWDVTVDVAKHGVEGLTFIQKQQYDLVLMDLEMPVMDGFETTKRIRAGHSESNKEVPIIAITSSNSLDAWNKALNIGMNDFITKPFNPNELYKVLERYVLKGDVNSLPRDPS